VEQCEPSRAGIVLPSGGDCLTSVSRTLYFNLLCFVQSLAR
jgi:hypothetical protein